MQTARKCPPIKPGQVYFDIKANAGWRYVRINVVKRDIVEVSFLEPLSHWNAQATGVLKLKELLARYKLTPEVIPLRKQKR